MSKIFIETDTLTGIANAIRSKTGDTQPISTTEMATQIEGITTGGNIAELTITSNGTYTAPEGIDGYTPITVNVPQDGAPPAEAFVITGNCSYRFANDGWTWFINTYGNQITTKDITKINYMFTDCQHLESIPFEINGKSNTNMSLDSIFYHCYELKSIPKMIGIRVSDNSSFMGGCQNIREIPEDIENWFDWSYIDNLTASYAGARSQIFAYCFSLRSIPMGFLAHGNPVASYSSSIFYNTFNNCFTLDEIIDLPNPHINATWTSNAFSNPFTRCMRLKNMTFKMPDGAPYIVNWKNQTIDLSSYVGYSQSDNYITGYNSGLTADTRITDDASYQALKDNPDSWTTGINYSRYNKTSAVATINSLPDASAYLATAGGTNTIKFKGASGALTDGGAINTLTEEEIAVATAKGWSVAFV